MLAVAGYCRMAGLLRMRLLVEIEIERVSIYRATFDAVRSKEN